MLSVNEYTLFEKYNFKQYLNEHKNILEEWNVANLFIPCLEDMSEYKASCFALRRAVRAAKLRYREITESHFQLNDSRRMWQGLKTIGSFGNKSSVEVRADPLLAEELNTLYGRFKCNGVSTILPSSASGSSRQSSDDHVITVSEDEVRRELKRVNVRKANKAFL